MYKIYFFSNLKYTNKKKNSFTVLKPNQHSVAHSHWCPCGFGLPHFLSSARVLGVVLASIYQHSWTALQHPPRLFILFIRQPAAAAPALQSSKKQRASSRRTPPIALPHARVEPDVADTADTGVEESACSCHGGCRRQRGGLGQVLPRRQVRYPDRSDPTIIFDADRCIPCYVFQCLALMYISVGVLQRSAPLRDNHRV